ncbi:hypothetical protein D9619_001387 [Psilocybe cf. subviscida]|uniref:Altered inheritance of mitochondria protein 41 n=1 Tax=Psilocybe cf. subviscida TaxID=2480587 RepID=A0A8H5F437_9AGAR|nr:hypothetical protein D9619_001387 [Psilocybe cf. subviscida]
MFSLLRSSLRTSTRPCRTYTTAAVEPIRPRLMAEIKTAMKARDTKTSTTLRSVLSEINTLEKTNPSLSESDMVGVARKAVQRRLEAVAKFNEANRSDLAENEQQEVDLLQRFLPALLSTADIDTHLKAALAALPAGSDPRKALGLVFKEFYAKVDKNQVDANVVKERAQELIKAASNSA